MRSASGTSGYWPPDMARRSYFRRIAEPLTSGLPALFSVPRAAPDERRPPAASASAGTPALRRTASSRSAASSPARAPRLPTDPAVEAVPTRSAPPPLTFDRSLGAAPADPVADTVSIRPAAAEDPVPTHSARLDWTEIPSATAAAGAISAADAIAPAEPGAVVLPLEPLATPPARLEPASPRIHIGTVEVRTTPQPLPPTVVQPPSPAVPHTPSPTSGNAAAPLARAYGWRFGLIQS
jgi:hypothetical protein